MGNVKCNWVPDTYAHDLWVVNAVTTGYYGPLAHFVCHAAFNFLFFLGADGVVSILGAASVRGGAGRGPQWFSVEAGCNGWYGCIAIIPSSPSSWSSSTATTHHSENWKEWKSPGGTSSTSSVSSFSRPSRKPEGQLPSSRRISFSTWKVTGQIGDWVPQTHSKTGMVWYGNEILIMDSWPFRPFPFMGREKMFRPRAHMVHDPTSARPDGISYRRFLYILVSFKF